MKSRIQEKHQTNCSKRDQHRSSSQMRRLSSSTTMSCVLGCSMKNMLSRTNVVRLLNGHLSRCGEESQESLHPSNPRRRREENGRRSSSGSWKTFVSFQEDVSCSVRDRLVAPLC